jgi:hypothetical protein
MSDASIIDLTTFEDLDDDNDSILSWGSLFVFLRWALRRECLFGDKITTLLSSVCRSWRRVCRDPALIAGLMRVVSFDIGMRNLALWAGSYSPDRPEQPFTFHHWELIDLETTVPFVASYNLVQLLIKNRPWLHLYYEQVLISTGSERAPWSLRLWRP